MSFEEELKINPYEEWTQRQKQISSEWFLIGKKEAIKEVRQKIEELINIKEQLAKNAFDRVNYSSDAAYYATENPEELKEEETKILWRQREDLFTEIKVLREMLEFLRVEKKC